MDVFIARQAILDREQKLYGYELLFRPCRQEHAGVIDDSASTLQVLSTALLSAGLSVFSENTPVFINFGREMLTTNWTSLFPSSSVVIEILESVRAEPELISACTRLRKEGYLLALDDVTECSDPEFLKLAGLIKVDFRATSPESQARLAKFHKEAGRLLLAEKVETVLEFERARKLGFDYFQGFFFSKPVILQGHQVPAMKGSVMRLLAEMRSPDLNLKQLESLIKCDVSLTYKLLRYVNSALFARSKPISDVGAALMIMGEVDIRRWIVLATLLDLAPRNSRVLAVHALVRARFCESLAVAAGLTSHSSAFLIGMFSLLDALTHRSLPGLLSELALPPEIAGPLLDQEVSSQLGATLSLTKCYEAGDWDQVALWAKRLLISQDVVADIYLSSINWAAQMLGDCGDTPARSMSPNTTKLLLSGTKHDLRALQQIVGRKSAEKRSVPRS